jgi:hypothetical protein
MLCSLSDESTAGHPPLCGAHIGEGVGPADVVQACASLKVGQESPSHHSARLLRPLCWESGLLLLVGANGLLQTIDVALHHILAI